MRARGAAVARFRRWSGACGCRRTAPRTPTLPEFDDLDVTGYYGTARSVTPDPVRIAALGDSTLTGPGLDHARQAFVAHAAGRRRRPAST